jgi:hypothetical protein
MIFLKVRLSLAYNVDFIFDEKLMKLHHICFFFFCVKIIIQVLQFFSENLVQYNIVLT